MMKLPPTKKDQTKNNNNKTIITFPIRVKVSMWHKMSPYIHVCHYIDSLHQKIFEWLYFWLQGFMSEWEKHPLNEVKGVLQLWRVFQIQGVSKSKEHAHGMWKIIKIIHRNFSFQNYRGTWRLKMQWIGGDLFGLRHDDQDSNGDGRDARVIRVLTTISAIQPQLHVRCHLEFLRRKTQLKLSK